MKVLTAPLWELAEFEEGKALLDRGKGHVAFSGLYDSQKLHMVYGLSDGFTQKIIVTFSDKRAAGNRRRIWVLRPQDDGIFRARI